MLGFLQYLIDSKRIDKSLWWNKVDRAIVQGSLSAWSDYERRTSASSSVTTGAHEWGKYIRGPKINDRHVGGSWRQAWNGHQRGLWHGVARSGSLVVHETYAERIFIWKVLNNVEYYSRTGIDIDGALGVGIVLAGYPRTYPATGFTACTTLHREDYGTFVSRYYKPPSGWRDWCNRSYLNT